MGTGPVPPGLLVQPAQLSRYGVPGAFLRQFDARPFLLQVATGGALGVMQVQWQYPGDTDWSAPLVSTAGSSWQQTLDATYADLTFAGGNYNQGDTYTVDAFGAVIPTGSAQAGLIAATRFSVPANACSAVTRQALTLMADAITQPLLTWEDDATWHAAAWVYELLLRQNGASPEKAAAGDATVLAAGDKAREYFRGIGLSGRPVSMTDSSVSPDGPLLSLYPYGDKPRGW